MGHAFRSGEPSGLAYPLRLLQRVGPSSLRCPKISSASPDAAIFPSSLSAAISEHRFSLPHAPEISPRESSRKEKRFFQVKNKERAFSSCNPGVSGQSRRPHRGCPNSRVLRVGIFSSFWSPLSRSHSTPVFRRSTLSAPAPWPRGGRNLKALPLPHQYCYFTSHLFCRIMSHEISPPALPRASRPMQTLSFHILCRPCIPTPFLSHRCKNSAPHKSLCSPLVTRHSPLL